MLKSNTYVIYGVAPNQKAKPTLHFPMHADHSNEYLDFKHSQLKLSQDFLKSQNIDAEIKDSFIEVLDPKRAGKWPELEKALALCKQSRATLLIPELGALTSNESFTQLLLESGNAFQCVDQPFVNQTILEALSKHAAVQRKIHGQLIKKGLKMTLAKSGNPNAAKEISKVNKPKIDTAIVFAFLLQPIIQDYLRKGCSQRQMVKSLNEEGFTAPEGGKWVLSQLQKVLDRVRLNELAMEAKSALQNFSKDLTLSQVAEALNAKGISSPKRSPWDEQQVKKLQERIQQVHEIVLINRFALDLLPVMHAYQARNQNATHIIKDCHSMGIGIRKNQGLLASNSSDAANQGSISGIDPAIRSLIERIKLDLKAFPEENSYLDNALESAAKHIPAYVKVVKGHIEQLAKVLDTANHDNKKLENVGLAEPVIQLMQLFRDLKANDNEMLEALSYAANHWQDESLATAAKSASKATTEA